MFPLFLDRVVEWVKAHKQFGFEIEERGSYTWVFLRTWRKDNFYRVAVGVIDRYYGDASGRLVILGQVLCAIGSEASLVLICGWVGQTPLLSARKSNSGAGTCKDCWTFDLRLFKRCLKKVLPLSLGRWIPFRLPNSSLPVSRVLSIVIGCSHGNLCDVQLRQVIFRFLG